MFECLLIVRSSPTLSVNGWRAIAALIRSMSSGFAPVPRYDYVTQKAVSTRRTGDFSYDLPGQTDRSRSTQLIGTAVGLLWGSTIVYKKEFALCLPDILAFSG
jgi:hypothetical protein